MKYQKTTVKRLGLLLALFLIGILLLTGCHGETETADVTADATDEITETVTESTDAPGDECDHQYREQSTTANCTERGIATLVCELCGHTRQKMSNPLGHDFVDYVCQREGCGITNLYYAADFGAVGDGMTDDGPAIRAAMEQLRALGGKLVFEADKTYYIGTADTVLASFATPFSFISAKNVTVDGQGSTFLMEPHMTYLVVRFASNVTVTNCNFDYVHSVYLVGTVKEIRGNTVTFATDLEPYRDFYDYTGMTAFSVKQTSGVQGYPHGFIKTMTKTGSREVTVTYSSGMTYTVGQKVYLPNPGIAHTGSECVFISHNDGEVTLENVEIRAARNFVVSVGNNDQDIYFKNVDLVPDESNTRELKMVSWRDGFHCKDNRGAIHWSDCENGVLFDDVMNIRNTLGNIVKITDAHQFSARTGYGDGGAFDCQEGDILDFYDQFNDIYYGYAKVLKATKSGDRTIIELDPTYCTVDLTRVSIDTCSIANRNTCAPGTTITDCEFSGSLRLSRAVTVENTVFNIYYAIWILAEGGAEGPLPGDITFRNCTFRYAYIHIDGYNRWDTGRYMPSIGSQITGIRAYDCTFENGCHVQSNAGCVLERYENGVLQK